MSSPYRSIFQAPGTKGFFLAGVVGRMPLSMLGIGVVTMMSQVSGRYDIAGALSAVLALSGAVLAPYTSRLVDRHGQRRVLAPAVAVTVLAVLAFLVLVQMNAPDWTLFVCMAAAGVTPSLGNMTRARWSELYRDSPLMHTAFSLESVFDEVVFIVGPILSIGLCTVWFPAAGPLLAVVFLAVGGYLLVAQRATQPPPHPQEGKSGPGALRSPGLKVLISTFTAIGVVFGAVDVTTVAFADERGHKAAASLVLAAYALGSCVAGIVFGTLRPGRPPHQRFLLGVGFLAVSSLLPLSADGLWILAVALFVSSLAVAPTLVTAMSLVERFVPRVQLTEGMTWTSTGLTLGVSIGASAAGVLVDSFGARTAFALPAGAAVLALLIAFLCRRRLRPVPQTPGTPLRTSGTGEHASTERNPDQGQLA
ncbi:MFS transporter [Streptomyces sp. NPDC048179]|uniref:MFS transporter n=1 Tax=Streptomyces sp. NPDC048179 TaxID=3365506 RepID=UPI003720E436